MLHMAEIPADLITHFHMEHKMRFPLMALAPFLMLPVAAQAQDFNVYGGLAFTSDYVFRGQSQTDKDPAVQAYLEGEYKGLYAGAWASNVDFGDNNDYEVDLYAGYRGELANGITYDAGYVLFYYNDSGYCCDEVTFTLGVPIGDQFTVTGFIAYDPSKENVAYSGTAEYAITEKWTLSGTAGNDDATDADWYDVGINYALSDVAALDLRYYDTDVSESLVVVSVSFDTTLFSR
jgi:uncharacterized protein (TIGR02001 family)